MKRALLFILAALLFAVAFTGLFPFAAVSVLAGFWHGYTVGLSADPQGWRILGGIGGAAAIGGVWASLSALWLKHRGT